MDVPKYFSIIEHYEACLEQHGDSHLGVDWPNLNDAQKRYSVMLEVTSFLRGSPRRYKLLDFGCGAGHLLEYIRANKLIESYEYFGLDLSSKFIDLCKSKFPGVWFETIDALKEPQRVPVSDVIVMNGVFTEKRSLTHNEMWGYFSDVLEVVASRAKYAVAFNLMSKQVDWERDELFHVSLDRVAEFLVKRYGRKFIIRNDYGLYEYTVYLFK